MHQYLSTDDRFCVIRRVAKLGGDGDARSNHDPAGWPVAVRYTGIGTGSEIAHQVTAPGGATVTVYQPQAISWPDQKTLTARMALAITPVNTKTPILGTVQLSFATATDKASGLVTLSDPKLDSSQFPAVSTDQASQIEQRIRAALPTLQLKAVPLNSLLLSLKGAAAAARPVAVNNDPPAILYAERPSSLVVFDGEPVLAPAGNSGLKFAVNTNWEVFLDPAGQGTWYLLNNGAWFAAPAATGPCKPHQQVAAGVRQAAE